MASKFFGAIFVFALPFLRSGTLALRLFSVKSRLRHLRPVHRC